MHRSKQKQGTFRTSAVSAGPHLNNVPVDESFTDEALQSGGQYEFTVKNNLYQLQSRCNSLQYDKYKRAISYIQTTNQLQNKTEYLEEMNSHLTQQVQTLSDERDILRTVLGEVREQNYSFSKEINQLKVQIHKIITQQPPHNHYQQHQQRSESIEMMRMELQQKQRKIQSLNQQLKNSQKTRITESLSLQHERQKQKLQNELNLETKRGNQLKIQIEELARHYKRKENEEKQNRSKLENQLKQLQQQIEQKQKNTQALKQEYLHLSKQLQQKTNNFRLLQSQRGNLQTKSGEAELQLARLKCQKTNLQQYKNYLETINQENEAKRKALQEQIFKLQSENSQIREELFSEKLEAKKQASKLKLQVDQQRIRYQQALQEKQKDINSLKQQLTQNQRTFNSSLPLLVKNKSQTELEKANQKISELKAENQEVRKEISNWESKLDKKHEKYCVLESKLKKQYEERIKQLQSLVYKQQHTIGELEYKLQFPKNIRRSEKSTQENRTIQNLKDQLIQKEKRIKQLQRSIVQLQNIIQFQQKRITKQQQHQKGWQISAAVKQQKISTISMLEQEIARLNRQLKSSQNNETAKKQELIFKEQKFAKQLAQLQNTNKKITQERDNMMKKMIIYQEDIKSKEISCTQMKQELNKVKSEKIASEVANSFKEQHMKTAMISNQIINRNQAKRIRQDVQTQSLKEIVALNQKIVKLQTQNIMLKEQYSQALQQINILLVKYQNLQQNYKKNHNRIDKHSTSKAEHLEHECQRLRVCLQRQEEEVKRLSQMLAASKHRVVPQNQQPRASKMSQHLWLGQEKFMINRLQLAKSFGKQHHRQV